MSTTTEKASPPPTSTRPIGSRDWRALEYHRTVERNRWIPKVPHPRQRHCLALADVLEVLFGGAAGGGKSETLLVAAAQYFNVPGYAALILRESFPDLNQPDALIPRSKEWWTGSGARWNGQEHRWTFPSGATLTFGYLERDDHVYQYQSAAYQFVGFDELTQHSEFRYRYMFSRLRKPAEGPLADVPLRMRSASNPGGKGHEWVKARFLDPRSRKPGAVFIPSRLDDNPSLDRAAYVKGLMHLDPLTRDRLLRGDWDAVASGRFKREWLRYYYGHGCGENSGYLLAGRVVEPGQIRSRFLTVDPAASVPQTAKDDPDWTVISAWALTTSSDLLWLGCLRLRVEVPDIVPRIAEQYLRHKATMAYIEGGGLQKGVAQAARRYLKPRMNVVEVNPESKDKLARVTPALNLAEGGRLWLPAEDPVFPVEDVEAELVRFTGDPKQDGHDDVVDTFGMAGAVAENKLHAVTQFVPYAVGGATYG